MGRDDFFRYVFRKSIKIYSGSNLNFLRFDFDFFFKFSKCFLEGKQTLLSKGESVKVTKNVIDF